MLRAIKGIVFPRCRKSEGMVLRPPRDGSNVLFHVGYRIPLKIPPMLARARTRMFKYDQFRHRPEMKYSYNIFKSVSQETSDCSVISRRKKMGKLARNANTIAIGHASTAYNFVSLPSSFRFHLFSLRLENS